MRREKEKEEEAKIIRNMTVLAGHRFSPPDPMGWQYVLKHRI